MNNIGDILIELDDNIYNVDGEMFTSIYALQHLIEVLDEQFTTKVCIPLFGNEHIMLWDMLQNVLTTPEQVVLLGYQTSEFLANCNTTESSHTHK